MSVVAIVAYLSVGLCAAGFRAYLDPWLLEIGVSGSYGEKKTMFYAESVLGHFLLWPLMLTMTGLTILAERYRRAGVKAAARRKVKKEAAAAAEREIDRIIKEHAL